MLVCGQHLLAVVHLPQQRVQSVGVLGAHHQIEFGHPAQQRGPLLLGDAAGHHQGQSRVVPFAARLATQVAVDLLLGVITDGAGVVEHQIRLILGGTLLVSHGLEDARHPFGVGLVHLAAKGGDPVGAAAGVGHGLSGQEVGKARNPVSTMDGAAPWQGETQWFWVR